jgi:glycosyltransferase involved in cell wall biosynthesis
MKSTEALPSEISIVVCSHNNYKGLEQLIPVLLRQDFPCFEVIIVNDRSTDATEKWLTAQNELDQRIVPIHISDTPTGWNAKKYALQQGIKKAQYSIVTLTDSDCIPASNKWLQHIAQTFTNANTNIYLGYSPYRKEHSILNKLIGTETLFTVFQYFSLAKIGMTYMGVGRNLAYRKSFIEKHIDEFPFQNHVGGDDDLLISRISKGNDAQIGINDESFVLSEPENTWQSWWQQKRRHLSAGQKYKFSTQCMLATYWLSNQLCWCSFFILCLYSTELTTIISLHAVILMLGIIILQRYFRIFQEGRLLLLFPFWDFLYIASSSIIGLSTFLNKNKKWS